MSVLSSPWSSSSTRPRHVAALLLRCRAHSRAVGLAFTASSPARRSQWEGNDHGMSTAEYALGTVAACAFAAVLFAILTSSEVRDVLTQMVTDALQAGG
ncbi:hypothetical protein GCM10009799_47010 [Nocardiopsis rhodophaea]|uniref:DUF4244 domain-containing protein n=1 Tax=Nocardiopsis rhodophaea TaxID=280238 RepID=A0ABP5F582_9ACTN